METKPAIVNALSVDVEEYFHAKVFQEGTGGATRGLTSRVEASTERVLTLLETHWTPKGVTIDSVWARSTMR